MVQTTFSNDKFLGKSSISGFERMYLTGCLNIFLTFTLDNEWINRSISFINSEWNLNNSIEKFFCLLFKSCFNETCQTLDRTNFDQILLSAVPFDAERENDRLNLFNRSQFCVTPTAIVSRLWNERIFHSIHRQDLSPVFSKLRLEFARTISFRILWNVELSSKLFWNLFRSATILVCSSIRSKKFDLINRWISRKSIVDL